MCGLQSVWDGISVWFLDCLGWNKCVVSGVFGMK